MTCEQEEKLYDIKKRMEVYDEAIKIFSFNKDFASKVKERFSCYLECLKVGNKNAIKLYPKGYFGNTSIEVDQEFIDMCLEYFKKKRKELDDMYEQL